MCCRLAGELPDTVALSEPINSTTFAGVATNGEASRCIEDFARQTRASVLLEGRAPSIVVDGRVDDDMVVTWPSDSGLRERQARRGEIQLRKPLTPDFTLIIKHNALFAALLAELGRAFECVALVRNPVAVLASWQTVDLPINGGRIPAGERFDDELQGLLQKEPDVLQRQIRILNWFFTSFQTHLPPDAIIRYEDLVSSGGRALFRLIGQDAVPPVPLENRNDGRVYRRVEPELLLDALNKERGAWSDFYSLADCMRVVDRIGAHR